LENGYFILPTGELEIFDSEVIKEKPIGLSITGVFKQVIEDYFINTTPLPILQRPWEFVNIYQKMAFQERLSKELALNTDHLLLKEIKKNKTSFLPATLYFSATAYYYDFVLFALYYTIGFESEFVVLHFPRNKVSNDELKNNSIEFYKDFDEFRYKRAFPDKVEWEY